MKPMDGLKAAFVFHREYPEEMVERFVEIVEENQLHVVHAQPISHDVEIIKETLFDLCMQGISLIICLGGTGIQPQEKMPEALSCIADKTLSGLENAITYVLMEKGSYAVMDRIQAGVFQKTILVALPGNPFLVQQILNTILPLVQQGLASFEEER